MAEIQIDLSKITQEVDGMTKEQIAEKLLKLRTRDKVQQKKSYSSENAKKYAAKAREQRKLLKQKAIEMGIWDQINDQAEAAAEAKLLEEAEEAGSEE